MNLAERILLSASLLFTAATGGVYFVMKYLMTNDDPFSVLNHPWQPHVLAMHLLIGPLLIFALGLIMREHVIGGLRDDRGRRGRATGVYTTLLAAPMILSGYLLQVFTDPDPQRWLAWIHIGCGTLFTILFLAHLLPSRKVRRAVRGGMTAVRSLPKSRGLLRLRLAWPRKRGLISVDRSWRGGWKAGSGGRTP